MDKLSSQFIVDIIASQMDMPNESVWLRDQNKVIPNDKGLYIVVGIVDSKTMTSESYMDQEEVTPPTDPITYNQIEVSRVNQREVVQIDVLSRSNAAIMRNWEVIAALQSIYAQQVQEENFFKIFRIPSSFLNTSVSETTEAGGSTLNKYSISFVCFSWYRKQRILTPDGGDYYDDFTTRVDDANTIGTDTPLIEFEINAGGIT